MSYEALAGGELAAVVTYLEMRVPPDHQIPASPLSLKRVEVPQPEHYRELFRLIGAPWLWFSRLILDDAHLASIIQHPKVELDIVLDETGREVGMLELDFREPHDCELSFVGLIPEQVDYEDYRDVDGLKLPFTIRVTSIDSFYNSTRTFTEIKLNVPIDESKFNKPPAPAASPR